MVDSNSTQKKPQQAILIDVGLKILVGCNIAALCWVGSTLLQVESNKKDIVNMREEVQQFKKDTKFEIEKNREENKNQTERITRIEAILQERQKKNTEGKSE